MFWKFKHKNKKIERRDFYILCEVLEMLGRTRQAAEEEKKNKKKVFF